MPHSRTNAAKPPWSKMKSDQPKERKTPMNDMGIIRMMTSGLRSDSKRMVHIV